MTADVFERLDEEHPRHGRASFQLATAFGRPTLDPEALREPLLELVDGMTEHFANEEDALFPWLKQVLPERTDDVDTLVRQHTAITLLVAEFQIALRRGGQSLSERVEQAKAFVRMMEKLSTLERNLVTAAVHRSGRPST